jgi:succinate dehydrogenase / fumarate reductase iron-sulfur subunit
MKITVEIKRFNPEKDKNSYFQKYEIEAKPTDRFLDILLSIKSRDPSLGLRRSCAHGVCGSDAMVINGKERLACKTLVKDIAESDGATVRVEPLRTLAVQRDLMVDQTKFFDNFRRVKPYLIVKNMPREKEWVQSPEQRKDVDEATNCILCAACYSSCPVVQKENTEYLGPAAIVQASRFMDDSRDRGMEDRVDALDYPDGIWPCRNYFECTRVCPRSIKVTKLINKTKAKILKFRKDRGGKIRDKPQD